MPEGGMSFFGMHIIRRTLLVPMSEDLEDSEIHQLQTAVLQKIKSHNLKGVLVDLTAVRVLDSWTFSLLKETAGMAAMMGAGTYFTGIQPGVASSLVDLDVDIDSIQTAVSIEEALDLLNSADTDEALFPTNGVERADVPEPDNEI